MLWLWITVGIILSLVLTALNYMILSQLMTIDYNDGGETAFCVFLSLIGSVFVIPVCGLIYGIRPILSLLDDWRDSLADKWETWEEWRKASREEKGIIKAQRKAAEDAKKDTIIKKLEEEIVQLKVRNDELNKYDREAIIEV